MTMRLALVDHHLANFHADKFLALLRTTYSNRKIEVMAYETDPAPGDDWCRLNSVTKAESIQEAVEWSDAILVLAPDDLDTHREFADAVLPTGKPVVFDKMLALDPRDAEAIVTQSLDLGTPIFAGSGLRYAAEVEDLLQGVDFGRIDEVVVRGHGRWEHYGIHTLSLALRAGGFDVTRVRDTGTAEARLLVLDHRSGDRIARRTTVDCRTGTNAAAAIGWSCEIKVAGEWRSAQVTDFDAFYSNLFGHYLDFLAGGAPEVSAADLLATVRILAASTTSIAGDGAWVEIP